MAKTGPKFRVFNAKIQIQTQLQKQDSEFDNLQLRANHEQKIQNQEKKL